MGQVGILTCLRALAIVPEMMSARTIGTYSDYELARLTKSVYGVRGFRGFPCHTHTAACDLIMAK